MKEILEVIDGILNETITTNGESNYYTIEETKLRALRELIKRETIVAEDTKSKYSDATSDFIFDLKRLLNKYCRTSIKEMSLIEDGKTVLIDGCRVDIEANSNLATIQDIMKILLR